MAEILSSLSWQGVAQVAVCNWCCHSAAFWGERCSISIDYWSRRCFLCDLLAIFGIGAGVVRLVREFFLQPISYL